MGHQVVGDDEALFGFARRHYHPAGGGAAGEDYGGSAGYGLFRGGDYRRGEGAGAEAGQHQAGRAVGADGVNQHSVGAGVGMYDVDAGQVGAPVNGEGGCGGVLADGAAVECHPVVGVDVAQEAEFAGLEGFHAEGVGLIDLAGAVDFVVEHGEYAHAGGVRGGGEANGVEQVQVGVSTDGSGRAHCAGDDNRAVGFDG